MREFGVAPNTAAAEEPNAIYAEYLQEFPDIQR
jgi:hypothetical protein